MSGLSTQEDGRIAFFGYALIAYHFSLFALRYAQLRIAYGVRRKAFDLLAHNSGSST